MCFILPARLNYSLSAGVTLRKLFFSLVDARNKTRSVVPFLFLNDVTDTAAVSDGKS